MAKTYDINTSIEPDTSTTPPTPPGETYRPLRYTTSVRGEIRVGLWLLLSTRLATYRLDTTQGLDYEAIMDSSASDTERSALVAEIVLGYPGVLGITAGPEVTVVGGAISISLTAETIDGPISLAT